MLLAKTYFPDHADNRMKDADDVAAARAEFLEHRPSNLDFLLEHRYGWMNQYIDGKEEVLEIGCGAGFSKEYINNPKVKLTDYNNFNSWIDEQVDALDMPYEDGSIDVVISSHMIHHLASPTAFFREISRVLKPGGRIVIHDTHTSFFLRAALRLMRHDGWSYEVDVFDESVVANNPIDPWSANAAIPELLFQDTAVFEQHFPEFEVEFHTPCEFLIFLISGGVTAKSFTVNLPRWLLTVIHRIDELFVSIAPSVFALSKKVVIRKLET